MKKVSIEETRKIFGGRWQCTKCKKKFFFKIQAIQHKNNDACYGGQLKFCL